MKQLTKDLIIVKSISTGGMGEVFLAKKIGASGFQKDVAIKQILPSMMSSFAQESFFMEAKVLANIQHPNIVQVYSFGEAENSYYLEMEYIRGINLRSLLIDHSKKGKAVPLVAIAYIISEAAAGLSASHHYINGETKNEMPVIHRDISPDNIMLSYSGDVKIIDFGIIKIENVDLTQTNAIKGKCSYMSPEQTLGEKLDPRTDIFSLGVVFWEALCSKRLFSEENEFKTLSNVVEKPIPSPHEMNPRVPETLSKIVLQMLQRPLALRTASADLVVQQIKRWMSETGTHYSRADLNQYLSTNFAEEIQRYDEEKTELEKSVKIFLNTQGSVKVEKPVSTETKKRQINQAIHTDLMNRKLAVNSREIQRLRQNNGKSQITKIVTTFIWVSIVGIIAYFAIIFFPFFSLDFNGNGISFNYQNIGNVRNFCPNYSGNSRFECFIEFVLPNK